MRRGTTPTHVFTVPKEIPVGTLTVIEVTYCQFLQEILTKTEEDVTRDTEENTLSVTLTQADTLRFQPAKVEIQVRAKTALGIAYASQVIKIDAKRILKEGEI